MRVYISGPMTGCASWNAPAFAGAAAALREHGHEPVNPADQFHGNKDLPRPTYMRRDIELLLTVDAITMLPGWAVSRGARLEHDIAVELGLAFIVLP